MKTSNQTRTINPKYGQKPGLAGKSHTDDEYQKRKKVGYRYFSFHNWY